MFRLWWTLKPGCCPSKVDQLDKSHVKFVGISAHGFDCGAHPRYVAMMIRPPDINQPVISTFEFVMMIGYIRGEICKGAVRFPQYAIPVIAKSRGPEPISAIFVKRMPGLVESCKALDTAPLSTRLFSEKKS